MSQTITPKNAAAWRRWLQANHATQADVWVVYVKKAHGANLSWSESVDEALCFGWIDTTVRKIDERHYMHRFTPRKRGSKWSTVNKGKVAALIEEGRMSKAGLEQIALAKRSGEWERERRPTEAPMPPELDAALNGKARRIYEALAPGYQNLYRRYVGEAKQQPTRLRRARQCSDWLTQGQKNPFGLPQAR